MYHPTVFHIKKVSIFFLSPPVSTGQAPTASSAASSSFFLLPSYLPASCSKSSRLLLYPFVSFSPLCFGAAGFLFWFGAMTDGHCSIVELKFERFL